MCVCIYIYRLFRLFIKLYSCFPRQHSIKQNMWMVENTDIKMCYTSLLPSPWQQQQPLLSSYEVASSSLGWSLKGKFKSCWQLRIHKFLQRRSYTVLSTVDCSHILIYGLLEYITFTEQTSFRKNYPASTRQSIIWKNKWER